MVKYSTTYKSATEKLFILINPHYIAEMFSVIKIFHELMFLVLIPSTTYRSHHLKVFGGSYSHTSSMKCPQC